MLLAKPVRYRKLNRVRSVPCKSLSRSKWRSSRPLIPRWGSPGSAGKSSCSPRSRENVWSRRAEAWIRTSHRYRESSPKRPLVILKKHRKTRYYLDIFFWKSHDIHEINSSSFATYSLLPNKNTVLLFGGHNSLDFHWISMKLIVCHLLSHVNLCSKFQKIWLRNNRDMAFQS